MQEILLDFQARAEKKGFKKRGGPPPPPPPPHPFPSRVFNFNLKQNALVKKKSLLEFGYSGVLRLFVEQIKEIFEETKKNKQGKVARLTYHSWPRINPEHFADVDWTVDGQRFLWGDSQL